MNRRHPLDTALAALATSQVKHALLTLAAVLAVMLLALLAGLSLVIAETPARTAATTPLAAQHLPDRSPPVAGARADSCAAASVLGSRTAPGRVA